MIMATIDERLTGIEESIRLITKYFKDEIESVKKSPASPMMQQSAPHDDLELRDVKRNLDALKLDLNNMAVNMQLLKKTAEKSVYQEKQPQTQFAQEIANLRTLVQQEVAMRESIERNLKQTQEQLLSLGELSPAGREEFDVQEINTDLTSLTKHLQDLKNSMATLQDQMKKNFTELDSYRTEVSSMKKDFVVQETSDVQELDLDLTSLRKSVQDLKNKMKYLETSKHTQDKDLGEFVKHTAENTQSRISALEKDIQDMKSVEKAMPEKVRLHMTNIVLDAVKTDLKLEVSKLMTEQLHDFAKELDKRLPELVSKDEFLRVVKGIDSEMKSITTPDLRPFAQRMSALEQRIREISGMMQGLSNRWPVVVE